MRLAVQTKVMRRKPSVLLLLLLLLLKKVTHAQQVLFFCVKEKVFCGQKTEKKGKGFSLFFREEYPAPRRAYSLRKKREREK
jgi:hypothetical protein